MDVVQPLRATTWPMDVVQPLHETTGTRADVGLSQFAGWVENRETDPLLRKFVCPTEVEHPGFCSHIHAQVASRGHELQEWNHGFERCVRLRDDAHICVGAGGLRSSVRGEVGLACSLARGWPILPAAPKLLLVYLQRGHKHQCFTGAKLGEHGGSPKPHRKLRRRMRSSNRKD